MIAALVFIWSAVAVLATLVWRREGAEGLALAGQGALGTARTLMLRLPFALLTASFLVQIVPVSAMSHVIGPNSGLLGIAVASVIGGFLPGGPMTSFPIAIVFMQGGAGIPQLVALIAGWSVFALHRLLAYEAPIMGWRFVALRSASCMILPILAGLFAEGLVALTGFY